MDTDKYRDFLLSRDIKRIKLGLIKSYTRSVKNEAILTSSKDEQGYPLAPEEKRKAS